MSATISPPARSTSSTAIEGQVGVRDLLASQGVDDLLGLGDRDDVVVDPLKHDERSAQPVDVMNRRPLVVQRGALGIWRDEPVEVRRLELVREPGERLE